MKAGSPSAYAKKYKQRRVHVSLWFGLAEVYPTFVGRVYFFKECQACPETPFQLVTMEGIAARYQFKFPPSKPIYYGLFARRPQQDKPLSTHTAPQTTRSHIAEQDRHSRS
jgi:hypothetical protein